MGFESVFSRVARDETLTIGPSRSVDTRQAPGKIIDAAEFGPHRDGFAGWRDHFHGFNPVNPLSLTAYPSFMGSHALQISACAAPAGYASNTGYLPAANAAAFKNLSRFDETGDLSYSTWFTTKSADFMGISEYAFLIDTQDWDDSRRSFYKAILIRNANGAHNLRIIGDADAAVGLTGSGVLYGIHVGGYNDNKYNFNYMRLTVNLASNQYKELQLNDQVWDLAGLGGTADHAPQTGEGPESFFSGGCNAGAYVVPGDPGSGPCSLYLSRPVFTIGEAA